MIKEYDGKIPSIHSSCYIAENVSIIGNVKIEEMANVWFGAVIRGDMNSITIGKNTNIQDNCVFHVERNSPLVIGDDVTVGHGAILHGCTIGNSSLIGMGSIVLNNAVIGKQTLVGAGSLIPEGKKIPDGVLCMGSPVKIIRELTDEEKLKLTESAAKYVSLSNKYK